MTTTLDPSLRLRNDLLALVRGRVPYEDAEDVVQATLVEAFASKTAPKEHEPFRKFAFGVAKNKIIDYYRARKRETFDVPEVEAPPPNHEERSLARWAEERVPDHEKSETLEWMLREGDGEKLEHIADDAGIPATRVRKRVSRLREHLRTHWKKEVALLAAMGVVAAIVMMLRADRVEIAQDLPQLPPAIELKIAEELRNQAHKDCEGGRFSACLEKLDRARDKDPAGDALPGVSVDRERAERALATPRVPSTPSSRAIEPPPTKRPQVMPLKPMKQDAPPPRAPDKAENGDRDDRGVRGKLDTSRSEPSRSSGAEEPVENTTKKPLPKKSTKGAK